MPQKTRILLVEDDASLGYVIKDSLEERGFEVTHATDGNAGNFPAASVAGGLHELCHPDDSRDSGAGQPRLRPVAFPPSRPTPLPQCPARTAC